MKIITGIIGFLIVLTSHAGFADGICDMVETSQDGTVWEAVADVKVNKRRLAVHKFDFRKVRDVRVTVTETYGDPSARIFEIGVW
jgi:hypothetical protein